MPLAVGDKAPNFSLVDQHGKKVKLSDFKGRKLIVYFYPKADTPGCTTQSCELRDAHPQLKRLGVAIVGISPDPPEKQLKFDDKYSLGFPLLADTDHAVAEAWDSWGEKSLYGKKYMGIIRSAFVVDEKGKLAGVFPKVSPKDTGQEGPQRPLKVVAIDGTARVLRRGSCRRRKAEAPARDMRFHHPSSNGRQIVVPHRRKLTSSTHPDCPSATCPSRWVLTLLRQIRESGGS